MAPISPVTNLSPLQAPPSAAPCDITTTTASTTTTTTSSSTEIVATTTTTDEAIIDQIPAPPPTISSFSSLPVALVVEQTARILEDIKRKIQLQKEEEERQRLEREREISPPEDAIFSATKSFIILKNAPPSLSPDSGTDYGPFSASSSISPPFLSSSMKDRDGCSLTPSRPHSESFKFPSYSLPFAAMPPSLSPTSASSHKLTGEMKFLDDF